MTAVVLCVVETCSSWCLAFAAVMWEPYGFFRVSKWQCYMIDVNYLYGIRRGLVAMSKVRFLAPALRISNGVLSVKSLIDIS